MHYRKLGWTDLQLSVIGLGTWAIGGGNWEFAWGPQDDERSIATIQRALDLGINWIDTAPAYGLGHSEEVIGKTLRGMHEKPILATKCTRVWDEGGKIYGNLKRESVLREAEASLARLGVEQIDLYQIHWPDPEADIEECWAAIEELVQSGKVRYAGVSNFNVAQMKRIQPLHPLASLQPPYSILRRDIEAEILPFCKENDIGVVAYSPLQKGLLTGKASAEWVAGLPEDDHRKRDSNFRDPKLTYNIKVAAGLAEIAGQSDHTTAQLAIAWTLRRSEVTAAIVGARSPSQIEETVPAGDWDLRNDEIEAVEKALETA